VFKGRDNLNAASLDSLGSRAQQAEAFASMSGAGGASSVPSISLPRGGGAIRGIGEKFAANPVTGTGAMKVPIATSTGRSGFGPQLSLAYESGAGNGSFGFGWNLSSPAIIRKTEKGLPLYRDADESDVFILSGAEDLVPLLQPGGSRFEDDNTAPGYTLHRYRPRIEGLFARIERWTNRATGEIHWRSISRDNITTLYGKTTESRIADPGDRSRVFSWLICQSSDDKGNAIVYRYEAENSDGVHLSQAHERNRTASTRSANRYLKRIYYGNLTSHLIQPDLTKLEWMFEVVLDYDEGHYEKLNLDPSRPEGAHCRFVHASATPAHPWAVRPDPFSSHRAGFEVRTYRRCRRILMFHHFAELGSEPYLIRSTEFEYDDLDYSQPITSEAELSHPGSNRFASFIRAVTQSGFVRDETQAVQQREGVCYVTYLRKSLPPLEFEYSKANIQDDVRELDAGSLENLPVGLSGPTHHWVDLDGEGVSGILTEQAEAWFYKRNLGGGRFGPPELVFPKPSLTGLNSGQQQLLDLAGDGHLNLVAFTGPTPGFYERTQHEDWEPFRAFRRLPNISWNDPNLRFVDLNGDGHADVLITEHEVFTWHPSLAEEGFGPARQNHQPIDEEQGPRLIFADGTQSIYLADMCGDGLTDLVRIRNGNVCYWPNIGYGCFGAKVTMDNSPWFDDPDQFNQQRVRLGDIDGSGTSDIIYLARDGVRLYFNQSGNGWSQPRRLKRFPRADNLASVMVADLLGNGTACLVWSSPLPGDARRPVRYIDLMGGQKPHLLIKSVNNLGAETHVQYAPSTKFYLADKLAGKPWITRIPFPVHVIERCETYDRINDNRFVTRYAYHHGYFDGVEREFRGFGMVEQCDTEEFAALNAVQQLSSAINFDASSHVPPVLTKTWFHTGIYFGGDRISKFFAGLLDDKDTGEYYREPGLKDDQARQLLLDDTVLPPGLSLEEEQEACRALKGSMLRQEIYALDGTDKQPHPYSVTEQNFTVRQLQPKGANRHPVFLSHSRESVVYHYERIPADPRVAHELTLEVDEFGNVLKTAAAAYGRCQADRALEARDQIKQGELHITYGESRVTNHVETPDEYRAPLPYESRIYELTGLPLALGRDRFALDELLIAGSGAAPIAYEQNPSSGVLQKRLIEETRTIYRRNDLGGALPLGRLESLALPLESYKLAFTASLLDRVYGDRTADLMLTNDGHYVHTEGDDQWWIPSGHVFFSPGATDDAAIELANARQHFFLARRYQDPFSQSTTVTYDVYDLLVDETRDALDNLITVGERDVSGKLVNPGNDYRVLQPRLLTDANGNRAAVSLDAIGMVVGTAVMGKLDETPRRGDLLDDFVPDLAEDVVTAHLINPLADPQAILARASKRLIYDLFAYYRTKQQPQPAPNVVYALVRETHDADLPPGQQTKIQHSFSYSDGFGREIQKKIQAEPDLVVAGEPFVRPRWVGSGWTIFNNKGKPVRQYEPFFSGTHRFEFAKTFGVSPILFYDPVERVVATLHPNHTFEKVVFDPWQQISYDVNDTVAFDPKTDADIKEFFTRLPDAEYLPTWYGLRTDPTHAAEANLKWPDPKVREAEQKAAEKAAKHADTPAVNHFDSLGRPFLTIAHNKFDRKRHDTIETIEEKYLTRVELDIEGNQREVRDANDRVVMTYDYDMLGNRIHQASMEAGERWMLNDATGKPVRAWDSRGHTFRTEYDELRRATRSFVTGDEPQNEMLETCFQVNMYGEKAVNAQPELNLRGKLLLHCDGAGVVVNAGTDPQIGRDEAYDFKANPLRTTRRLAREYKKIVDWNGVNWGEVEAALSANQFQLTSVLVPLSVMLETEPVTSSTSYDALNRPIVTTTPDGSAYRPTFNEANLLDRVDVNLRGATANGQPVWTPFVTNLDHNAKGQRVLFEYGNNVKTNYEYDRLTFRLTQMQTLLVAEPLQDLRYTYDPGGNITQIQDLAQQTIYFKNQVVTPSNDYVYDAIYRLINAEGREHITQVSRPQTTWDDQFRVHLPHPNDGQAMRRYIERYEYDSVGNFLQLIHQAKNGNWTRSFAYNEPSLVESGKDSNRLSSTTVGVNDPEPYAYDPHGNMTAIPHLTLMQ